jgi:serine/threonine protein kinase
MGEDTISKAQKYCPKCGTILRGDARFCYACGDFIEVIPRRSTGQLPSQSILERRYLVVGRLSQGGMGAIYKALDTRFEDREVVIKEMSQTSLEPSDREMIIKAFILEANLLARLNHPNIPTVYDFFSANERSYVVMELVQGENLQETLRNRQGKPFPEPWVRAIARQLCDVLTYLHTLYPPIIFRDLKPDNIMLQPDGQIKLIDFGIARLFKPSKNRDTVALGTPGYAAPEQYGGGQTDIRSDVYSLGATLLTLATGFEPSSSPFNFPPARSLNPSLTANFEQVIQRATQNHPANRFQTVEQLCAALSSSQQASAQPALNTTQWLKDKIRPNQGKLVLEETKIGLQPISIRPRKSLEVSVKQILEQERRGIIEQLATELNKAEGKIIPLLGFKGVGTSYVASRAREQVLLSRHRNLDIIVQINFSSENSDEMLETLLRRLRHEQGQLKRKWKLRKTINEAYDIHISKVDPKKRRIRSLFRSPHGKSGIRVDLPFVISFGDKFKIGGPIGVERFDEPALPEEDNETQAISPQAQRDLSKLLRDLIDILLNERIKVGFIFDKITTPTALDNLYQILSNPGVSTIVVLDVEDYHAWKKDKHPLTQYDDLYVPCLWNAGEKLCQHLFSNVDGIERPTVTMFSKYIEFMGQGRPKDFIRQINQYYTPAERRFFFWNDTGRLNIEKRHLEAIATYGWLLNALEENIDELVPAMYDNHPYRYDVARLHMYRKIGWMIDRVKEGATFSSTDIVNSEDTPEVFKPLYTQVIENLLDRLSSNGIVEVKDGQVHTIGLIPNMTTAHLLFCQNPDCRIPLRPQANYCHKCKTPVSRGNHDND